MRTSETRYSSIQANFKATSKLSVRCSYWASACEWCTCTPVRAVFTYFLCSSPQRQCCNKLAVFVCLFVY